MNLLSGKYSNMIELATPFPEARSITRPLMTTPRLSVKSTRTGAVVLNSTDVGNAGAVLKAGDTMTGALNITMPTPVILLNKSASGQSSVVQGRTGTSMRWAIALGDTTAGVNNVASTSGSVDAKSNWWGCVAGPGNAGCDAALACHLEEPDVPRAGDMRAAAQLHGELADAQHAHVLVVFLA